MLPKSKLWNLAKVVGCVAHVIGLVPIAILLIRVHALHLVGMSAADAEAGASTPTKATPRRLQSKQHQAQSEIPEAHDSAGATPGTRPGILKKTAAKTGKDKPGTLKVRVKNEKVEPTDAKASKGTKAKARKKLVGGSVARESNVTELLVEIRDLD